MLIILEEYDYLSEEESLDEEEADNFVSAIEEARKAINNRHEKY